MRSGRGEPATFRQLYDQYFGEDAHESLEISLLPEVLTGVKTFVDVGSSLGQYARAADEALNDADIYCIEPDPERAHYLRRLVERWEPASRNRFHVLEVALGNHVGEAEFFRSRDGTSSGALFPLGDRSDSERIRVETRTLDAIFADRSVDVIKIDVEGAEHRVLEGAISVIRRDAPQIILEIAPWGDPSRGHRPSDTVALLRRHGYTFAIFGRHYLFYRSTSPWAGLKMAALRWIIDRHRAKQVAKRMIEAWRSVRKRQRFGSKVTAQPYRSLTMVDRGIGR